VVLTNSILSQSKASSGNLANSNVKLVGTIVWDGARAQDENPDFINPGPQRDGQADAFNSRKFSPAKGYFNMATTPEKVCSS
jgi:hypothetical protein